MLYELKKKIYMKFIYLLNIIIIAQHVLKWKTKNKISPRFCMN
jgi:hypothetical protein